MDNRISKRRLLVGGGGLAVLALVSSQGSTQEANPVEETITPEVAGQIHNDIVLSGRSTIADDDPLGMESFDLLLTLMIQIGLLTSEAADQLRDIIAKILDSNSLDEIVETVVPMIEDILDTLGRVAQTVAAIVRATILLAQEILGDEEFEMVVRAIAADIRGALDGAVGGARVGSAIPVLGSTAGAIFGAAVGGGTASVLGYYERTA